MEIQVHEPEPIEIEFSDQKRLINYKRVIVLDAETEERIDLNHDQLLIFATERVSRMRNSMEYKRFVEDAVRFGKFWSQMERNTYNQWIEGLNDEQCFAYLDVRSGMFDEEINAYQESKYGDLDVEGGQKKDEDSLRVSRRRRR